MSLKQIQDRNGFHAIIFLSILYLEKKCKLKLPFKILRKFVIQGIYCSEVHPDSFISLEAICTTRLPHPYMIIIHRETSIGIHCTIFQETTIGVIEKEKRKNRPPVIKDYVYIGCKSAILGDLVINNKVKIGAMSLVLKDVPKEKTICGVWK